MSNCWSKWIHFRWRLGLLSSRYFGLGCDNLIELELIDYKGKVITANETCHKDLFWACRGAGGGNFGIVVSLTFKLPPIVDKVTFVELYWPNASVDIQKEFLHTWQSWLVNLNSKMTIGASIYNSAVEGLQYMDEVYITVPQKMQRSFYKIFTQYKRGEDEFTIYQFS